MVSKTKAIGAKERFFESIGIGEEESVVIPFWVSYVQEKYLTGAESKVLNMVKRETYFRHRESARISYEQFRYGINTEDGTHRMGTYMGLNSIKKALKFLMEAKVVVRLDGPAREGANNAGSEYQIQPDVDKLNADMMIERYEKKQETYRINAMKSAAARKKNQGIKNE